MADNRFFFVNVCHRLVCAVYFVIVPIENEFQPLQYAHISM